MINRAIGGGLVTQNGVLTVFSTLPIDSRSTHIQKQPGGFVDQFTASALSILRFGSAFSWRELALFSVNYLASRMLTPLLSSGSRQDFRELAMSDETLGEFRYPNFLH